MTNFYNRRIFLLTAATTTLTLAASAHANEKWPIGSIKTELVNLEKSSGGRLGVYALNFADGTQVCHRADERFPLCSTFKVILVSAILNRSRYTAGLMQQRVHYIQSDLVNYSPISEKHIDNGMTVSELCAAAIQYSDNTAANQLIKILGGPFSVTAFARSIGNKEFHLDRLETELNTAIPGDLRDTVTPAAMGYSLERLALGNALSTSDRKQLNQWLLGNTTGAKRIRAAVPADWQVGDKTGSGDYGTANDIALLWPPGHKPIILAIYHTQKVADAKWRDEVIAATARTVISGWNLPTSDPKPRKY